MHNECTEFAVRNVENDLHLLLCRERALIGCRRSLRIVDLRLAIAEKFDDCVANDFADIGFLEIEGFASEVA